MAETDWKPGDVVVATVKDRPDVRLVAGWSRYEPRLRWCELSPRWGDGDDDECWFMPNQVTDARPLLVIAPEDRDQVERLVSLLHETPWFRDQSPNKPTHTSVLQNALRAMLAPPKPPKPEEPLGLGAVVVDADGKRWSRCANEYDNGTAVWYRPGQGWTVWCDIDAVGILSQGVTP